MNILEHLKSKLIIPLNIGGIDISLTNQTIVLFAATLLVIVFFAIASFRAKIIPGKIQSLAEMYILLLWEYLEPLVQDRAWLPFFCAVFSLIFFSNFLGLIPGVVPPTANISFTATLAVLIFLICHAAGVIKHGPKKYLASLVPSGIPAPILIFIVPVEIISQLARPFSLAVRLFANIFAGHAIIITIISMIFIFKSAWVVPFPILGNVLLLAFEVFVAFIQAFVFVYLSALYIGSSLELEH